MTTRGDDVRAVARAQRVHARDAARWPDRLAVAALLLALPTGLLLSPLVPDGWRDGATDVVVLGGLLIVLVLGSTLGGALSVRPAGADARSWAAGSWLAATLLTLGAVAVVLPFVLGTAVLTNRPRDVEMTLAVGAALAVVAGLTAAVATFAAAGRGGRRRRVAVALLLTGLLTLAPVLPAVTAASGPAVFLVTTGPALSDLPGRGECTVRSLLPPGSPRDALEELTTLGESRGGVDAEGRAALLAAGVSDGPLSRGRLAAGWLGSVSPPVVVADAAAEADGDGEGVLGLLSGAGRGWAEPGTSNCYGGAPAWPRGVLLELLAAAALLGAAAWRRNRTLARGARVA